MNPQPGVTYVGQAGFLADNESWLRNYDLVGQVVQQGDVFKVLPGMIAQRTFGSAEALAHPGPKFAEYNDRIKADTDWIVRREFSALKKLNRVKGNVTNVVDFARDVSINAKEDYMTIDVFASKEDPTDRRFQVRTFAWRVRTNSFEHNEPHTNERIIDKITGGGSR